MKPIILNQEDEAKVATLLGLSEDTRPLAVIWDRDGTLAATHNGPNKDTYSRGSKEDKACWAAFNAALPFDAPVPVVVGLLRAIKPGVVNIMVSGRMEGDHPGDRRRRFAMLNWLEKHNLPIDLLIMREGGDSRKDSVVKEEILINQILPFYRPVLAVDDRPEVLEVWRKYHILTIAVKNPGTLPPIAFQTLA